MKENTTIAVDDITLWASELGFAYAGVTGCELSDTESRLNSWIGKGYHADLDYMVKHGTKRTRPTELEPWTRSIIVVGMNYLPASDNMAAVLTTPEKAYLSRYCLGRDYHKVMKKRLESLASKIAEGVGEFSYRAFVDSAPVMERSLARNAGVGWIGKNSMLINKNTGSYNFLGVLYTDLELEPSSPTDSYCGSCSKCIDACPTGAIVAPYQIDARRCISYLTIENKGEIPVEFRAAIGNRVFGCDDCQICCPWNRFAQVTSEDDFAPRNNFNDATLLELFNWTQQEFEDNTLGMSVRRVGYDGWLRNIAVALGNGPLSEDVTSALKERREKVPELVQTHVDWALAQHSL